MAMSLRISSQSARQKPPSTRYFLNGRRVQQIQIAAAHMARLTNVVASPAPSRPSRGNPKAP